MKISIAQTDVLRADPEENLKKSESYIKRAAESGSELICFPEMWLTGFDWKFNEEFAHKNKDIVNIIGSMAKENNIWINGTMPGLDEESNVSNTSMLFDNKGERVAVYRKTHLFSYMHEDKHTAKGTYLTLADTPWGKIGLSVCYDIRFPELFRTYALKGARLILSPMAFPYPRLSHWKILVRARAIENQLFMVGVNQVGDEDFGKYGKVTYFGSSVIVDPWGETVIEAEEKEEELLSTEIDLSLSDEIRNKMKVLSDRRPELYELG
ncbi:MAG: nitrilase-related carbon-nitrogen hydrolase [Armatimonadota bacterium]